ncbi:MAG: metal ABC transporter solute-binding protein, Zn/Mn family [Pseudonocardia sp.]
MRLRRALAPAAVLTAGILAAACGAPAQPADQTAPAAPAGPAVVASTNVYGAIAAAVGGDRATVTSLITDPAADPHSYESTPADALTVGGARIVVLNGGGYDAFMPGLVETAATQPTVIDVSELSGLEPAEEAGAEKEHAEDEHGHGEDEHGHGAFNEHVWYSLPTVQKLATRLAADLGTADAAGAAAYTADAEAFNAEVTELSAKVQALATASPGARVALTEPLPVYLVEQAGLRNATPEEFAEAVEEDTDPPAAVVRQTLALFEGPQKVRALILNSQTQTPVTDQVRQAAEAAGVPVVEMSETLPAGTTDYVTWMGGQIDALTAALARGTAP